MSKINLAKLMNKKDASSLRRRKLMDFASILMNHRSYRSAKANLDVKI